MGGLYDDSGSTYDQPGSTYNSLTADGTYVELPGRFSMSPNPFDQVRALETYNRLTLKLPGGHTRYVSCDIGAMVTIPVVGIYRADLTLTDTTAPSIEPPEWIL